MGSSLRFRAYKSPKRVALVRHAHPFTRPLDIAETNSTVPAPLAAPDVSSNVNSLFIGRPVYAFAGENQGPREGDAQDPGRTVSLAR